MRALVLAAGLGTRLREIAPNTPKPLMQVGNSPLLKIILDKLFALDVREVIINTHYLSEQIVDFISCQSFKNKVKLMYEPQLLGTAGTLKKHLDLLADDHFFVLHADNFFQDNLSNLLRSHIESPKEILMSMGTFEADNPRDYGTVKLDSNLVVTDYREKDPRSPYRTANSAIYIMKPTIYGHIYELSEEEKDISCYLIPKLVNRIQTAPLSGFFIDIGTPATYKQANQLNVKDK